jgi:uncharacterized membrane protein
MSYLTLGIALFLSIHLTRALVPAWRDEQIARMGAKGWKGFYSVVSLLGFGLIVWGFGEARQTPVVLWQRLPGMGHLAALLMLVAFVLLAASFVPANHLKARLRHPMTLAVKLWALAHLLANNTLADALLFGSFLIWAVVVFRSARRRYEPAPTPGTAAGTALTLVIGVAAWAVTAFWMHGVLIGVRPLG